MNKHSDIVEKTTINPTRKNIYDLVGNSQTTLITQLIKRFSDVKNWQIIGLVECDVKSIKEDNEEKIYVIEKRASNVAGEKQRKHFKQVIEDEDSVFPSEYVWQTRGVSDKDYYGSVMLPIVSTGLFIKVSYSC